MLTIRASNRDDLRELELLLRSAGLPTDDLVDLDFIVLDSGSALVGCVALESCSEPSVALLRSLVVAPSMRRTGWGQHLLDAISAHARIKGVATLYLLTTTAQGYFEARGWRRGYRSDAPPALHTTSMFSSLCPSTAVCMVKSIEAD